MSSDLCIIKSTDMKVEQIYTGCLAHGAYYIESNIGNAVSYGAVSGRNRSGCARSSLA
jgi:hypothetical protein